MTKKQIDAIKRKEARQIVESPTALGLIVEVEQALNLEWWRGYHAAKTALLSGQFAHET